jgi:hypothetical protein
LPECRLCRIEYHQNHFRVSGLSAANILVGRMRSETAGIADGCNPDPGYLPKQALGSPEAAKAQQNLFKPGWKGGSERSTEDMVSLQTSHGPESIRQCLFAAYQCFLVECNHRCCSKQCDETALSGAVATNAQVLRHHWLHSLLYALDGQGMAD